MTAGAARGRRVVAACAGIGVAVAALSVAACGSGGAGLANAAGVGQPTSGSPGSASAGSAADAAAPAASAVASAAGSTGNAGSSAAAESARSWRPDPFLEVSGYLSGRADTVLAAVYDVRTGQTWRLGEGPAQDEASVVKLDILETLLSAADGTGIESADQGLAQQMIEDSDNDAATDLWYAAGGATGLTAYDEKAGLTGTTPSSCVVCQDFPWPGWGLSTTTPADQLRLLKQLIKPSPLLTAADRRYALSLLENVRSDQAWGVSGGVPPSVTVALKNGWLPLTADNTDWQVNSEGWISGDGRDYLIAVLSTNNPTEQYGIDTINELSSLIWSALR